MPISEYFGGEGRKVMRSMRKTYGNPKKAKQVFYATANKQGETPGGDARATDEMSIDEQVAYLKSLLPAYRKRAKSGDRTSEEELNALKARIDQLTGGRASDSSKRSRMHRALDRAIDEVMDRRALDEIKKLRGEDEGTSAGAVKGWQSRQRSEMPAVRSLTDRFKSKEAMESYLHSDQVSTNQLGSMLNLMDKNKGKLNDPESQSVYKIVSKVYEERAGSGRE